MLPSAKPSRAFEPPMSPWLASDAPSRVDLFPSPHLKKPSPSPHAQIDHHASPEDYWNRYQDLKRGETLRNDLFEELLLKYDSLNQRMKEYQLLLAERGYDPDVHRREQTYQRQIQQLQSHLGRDPYIVILIDGTQFDHEMMDKGQQGGQEAAALINSGVLKYIEETFNATVPDLRVIARVYCDVDALCMHWESRGLMQDSHQIKNFAKGFTDSRPLFDYIDVSHNIESIFYEDVVKSITGRVDGKLNELVKLHLTDHRCQQIFFGGRHSILDELIEDSAAESQVLSKITLIDADLHEESLNYPFRIMTIAPLVGNHNILSAYGIDKQLEATSDAPSASQVLGSTTKLPPARAATISSGRENQKPRSTAPASPTPKTPTTWAATIANPQTQAPTSKPVSPNDSSLANRSEGIPRNRKGQRIDPSPSQPRDEVARVKGLKLCNMHFLRQDCTYGSSCTHDHEYKPTAKELQALSVVARMAPCVNGSSCDDVKCVYGHGCAAPEAKGGKAKCIHGDSCRFPPEMHGIDRKVVTMTKV